jgi:serine/threonine-protein kinase RsbW
VNDWPVTIQDERPTDPGELVLDVLMSSESGSKNRILGEILDYLADAGENRDDPRVRLVLDEALVNAIEHGNKLDPSLTVDVKLYFTPAGWALRLEDQGEGFDPESLIDPPSEEGLERDRGRGVLVMKEICRNITYYDGGRGLLLEREMRNDG